MTTAAELELLNNISSAKARENFDKWWNEDRAAEINERWTIKRKFLDAKGEDPSLASRYVLVDVLANVGDHKRVVELLDEQIEKKGHQKEDVIWVSIKGCNYVSTEIVCKNLSAYANIEKLALGESIEADDAPCVATLIAAPDMTTLTMLDLSNNKLESAGATDIFTALTENTRLTDVDLSNCAVGQSCGKHVAAYLALQRLLLNGNKLGIYGAKDLVEGLSSNRNLTVLGLYFNNMGEEGVEAVLNVLRDSGTPEAAPEKDETPEAPDPVRELEASIKEGVDLEPSHLLAVAVRPRRCAANVTLLQVEVGDNKASNEQVVELDRLLEMNNADARNREVNVAKMKELKRLEEEEAVRRQKEEEEHKLLEAQKVVKVQPPPAAVKKGAKAPSPSLRASGSASKAVRDTKEKDKGKDKEKHRKVEPKTSHLAELPPARGTKPQPKPLAKSSGSRLPKALSK